MQVWKVVTVGTLIALINLSSAARAALPQPRYCEGTYRAAERQDSMTPSVHDIMKYRNMAIDLMINEHIIHPFDDGSFSQSDQDAIVKVGDAIAAAVAAEREACAARLVEYEAESRLYPKHKYIPTIEGDVEVFHVACDECGATATILQGVHFWCSIHAAAARARSNGAGRE